MKKTWNIGERCRYGTFRILKTSNEAVTVGLSFYREKKVQIEETFNERFALLMWLEEQMDSYHAGQIMEELENNGIKLKQASMW